VVQLAAREPHPARDHIYSSPRNYLLICYYLRQACLFYLLRRIGKKKCLLSVVLPCRYHSTMFLSAHISGDEQQARWWTQFRDVILAHRPEHYRCSDNLYTYNRNIPVTVNKICPFVSIFCVPTKVPYSLFFFKTFSFCPLLCQYFLCQKASFCRRKACVTLAV
jgi:hypothetical protein